MDTTGGPPTMAPSWMVRTQRPSSKVAAALGSGRSQDSEPDRDTGRGLAGGALTGGSPAGAGKAEAASAAPLAGAAEATPVAA
eukprot:8911212-Alexandrium_andersonii.AAC.1